jgi:hypothetical protein
MSRRKRSKLTAAQKAEIWRRWKAGQSLHEIGRAFDKPHTTVHQFLLLSGGIRPAARRRSRLALTLAEREDISRGIASGWSSREIAGRMNRAVSTVSREVVRHGGRPAYRAHDADRQATPIWQDRFDKKFDNPVPCQSANPDSHAINIGVLRQPQSAPSAMKKRSVPVYNRRASEPCQRADLHDSAFARRGRLRSQTDHRPKSPCAPVP